MDSERARSVLLYIYNDIGVDGYLRAFKLLYLAERYHLAKYGRPILDDDYCALPNGPVPTTIYDTFKSLGKKSNNILSGFDDSFKVEKYTVTPLAEPDMDELSPSMIEALDYSLHTFRNYPTPKLVNESHDDAWNRATNRSGLRIMELKEIAEAGGASNAALEYLTLSLENNHFVD
ncbi:Panacea domain-containing protein [Roseivirga sp.]|uniref:Panacea domain-containing protein n=1 Tax=Roseivirga sp. TaxID=1964215 RepID=UPI002B27B1F2|nr:Panacea domain-containing protein [Roseivirga sp.]